MSHLRALRNNPLLFADTSGDSSFYTLLDAVYSKKDITNGFTTSEFEISRTIGNLEQIFDRVADISLESLNSSIGGLNLNTSTESIVIGFEWNSNQKSISKSSTSIRNSLLNMILDRRVISAFPLFRSFEVLSNDILKFNVMMMIFLRSGLSYFVAGFISYRKKQFTSLFYILLSDSYAKNDTHRVIGITSQLLALGFGRRELHVGLQAFDAGLEDTRQKLGRCISQGLDQQRALRLRAIVDIFDAGPLSLLQLSRIQVRRTIGGSHFAKRVQRVRERLPPSLYSYIYDPTELMCSD